MKSFSLFTLSLIVGLLIRSPSHALTQECQDYLKTLPANTLQGWISVPENWNDRHSKKIKIFYYGFHFQENPMAAPLVYFNGGPGASSHGVHEYLQEKPEYAKIPFLFIDQRGTGCSDPLPKIEYSRRGVQETALYGARAIVMDAEAIRLNVFKGAKWKIFGQSYGSLIVHRYLEIAPSGIKAAYAHGGPLMENGIAWTENRIRAFKRVGDEYFKKYPADRAKIQRAHLLFPKTYCMHSSDADICGDGLLDMLGWSALSFPEFGMWEKLHRQIESLLLPTGDLDMVVVRKLFPEQSEVDPGSFLVDVVPAREAPGGLCNTWSCELAIPSMEAKGEKPMDYEFNECRTALATRRSFDYRLIKEVIGEDYPSLQKIGTNLNPNLSFFLYSGEMDTFGPRESYVEEVKRFGSRVVYRPFSGGHGSYLEEPQLWKDILSQ